MIFRGGLRRDGLITALFCIGYALARIVSENFRQPDIQLGYFAGKTTMGMLLSLPLLAIGLLLLLRAYRRPKAGEWVEISGAGQARETVGTTA